MTRTNEELERELEKLKEEFHAYRQKRQEEESKRLRTALIAAGGIILAMGGFLWSELIWPVIKAGRP